MNKLVNFIMDNSDICFRGDFAVLVLSCDAYSDLWPIFFTQFEKYWKNKDHKIYLACNEKRSGIQNVNDALSGPDIDWSTSLKASLKQIEEKYVLIMIDDAFLWESVDQKRLGKYMCEFVSRDMDYFRLKNSPLPDVKINQDYGKISPGQLYRTALFPSLWKRDFLLEMLKPGESAWEFELRGSDRSDKHLEFYSVYKNVFKVIHGVIKGKWDPNAIKALKQEGVENIGSRKVLSFREVLNLKLLTIRHYALKLLPGTVRKKVRRFVYKNILKKAWFA